MHFGYGIAGTELGDGVSTWEARAFSTSLKFHPREIGYLTYLTRLPPPPPLAECLLWLTEERSLETFTWL